MSSAYAPARRFADDLFASLALRRAEHVARSTPLPDVAKHPGTAARRLARYLAVVELAIPVQHIARVLGHERRQVRAAVRFIEELREDARLDDLIETVAMEIRA